MICLPPLRMSKFSIKKISALLLLFALFCVAGCLSCVSKDGDAAGSPPPAEEAVAEPPVLAPREALPEDKAAKPVEKPQEKKADPPPAAKPVENPAPAIEEAVVEKPEPPAAEEPAAPAVDEEDGNEVVVVVNDVAITRQEFIQTKSEVEDVVEELNKITREKNYTQWLTYLDGEYRSAVSDKAYLAQISNSLPKALRDRRVRLNSLRDYFEYVFVPSRQNIRVDDIQYITPTRVYVIMDMTEGTRAAVYILEKGDDGSWKLVNKS